MANPHFKNLSLVALAVIAAACAANPPQPAAPAPAPQEASSASASVDLPKIEQHLREHQKYPATRAELLADCDNLKDFSANEKSWFARQLENATYASADDVMVALRRTP